MFLGNEIFLQRGGNPMIKSEVRSQKSEVRSQKSEVRSQKSEVRSQKSEVRSQKSEQLLGAQTLVKSFAVNSICF